MERIFNKKRLWIIIATIVISLFCSMCLVACNGAHTHRFVNYQYNNDVTCGAYGTETAKCEFCAATDTRKSESHPATGKHEYQEYVCLSCGDLKPDAPYTEGLEYTEIVENEQTVGYSVTGRGNTGYDKYIKIPSEYNGLPITDIGNEAFLGSGMLCVMMPDTVTSIGDNAFSGCYKLHRVYMPNSVTYIGSWAFNSCTELTDVTIPNSVTTIGFNVFDDCWRLQYNGYENGSYLGNSENPYYALISVKDKSISSFKINDNTKVIADVVFNGCWKLTSIKIPNSVTTIGSRTFYMCRELKRVDIPNSLEIIGEHAFFACTSLTSITIPSSVTSIGECAFLGCNGLSSLKYNGTMDQWESISICDGWNNDSSIKTVECTDGTITL